MHIAYARTNTRIWISPPPPVYIDRENVAYVSIYRGLDGRANCKIAGQIEAKIRSRMLYNGRIIKLFEHSQKLLATDRCKLVNRNRARAQISLFNERSPSLAITGWWPGLSRIGTTASLFISRFRPIDFFDSLTHFFPPSFFHPRIFLFNVSIGSDRYNYICSRQICNGLFNSHQRVILLFDRFVYY